jgi:hypothetical protein
MHGTRSDPKRHHPVVDLEYWRAELAPQPSDPLHDLWIDGPRRLVHMEARRAAVLAKLAKRPEGTPADLFLWGYGFGEPAKPYLTRVGGLPWRDARKPWPKGENDRPLTFIGQLCFLDSKDIIAAPLPGDVLLVFSEFSEGYLWWGEKNLIIEWSPIQLDHPTKDEHVPKCCRMPFKLYGAIHRIMQYPDERDAFGERSVHDAVWQGTIIGPEAFLPQFSGTEGLIATFGSILPSENPWPMLNVPALPVCVLRKGNSAPIPVWELGIGDAGVIIIRRNEKGVFSAEVEF